MARHLRPIAVSLALSALAACSIRDAACGRGGTQAAPEQTAAALAPSVAANAPGRFKIAFLGDSLTAGLGLLSEESYPLAVQRKFATEGYDNVEVINAGVSGDTTAGSRRRVDDLLEPDVRILVVALGGNDALRGLTPGQTHENLAAIIETARAKGVHVLLAGMEAPTNLGQDYQEAFHQAFVQVARDYRDMTVYMPFLLEGVAGNPALNQADGIHPNKEGARIVADNMYPKLRLMVDQLGGGG